MFLFFLIFLGLFKFGLIEHSTIFVWAIFFPLFSFLYIALLGGGSFGSIFLLYISLELFFLFYIYYDFSLIVIEGPVWFSVGTNVIRWSIHIDAVAIIMCLVVMFISFLVQFYSLSYMWEDPRYHTFMSYLSLFSFFMIILIISGTLVQLFIGWEGVGLCSFLLISFWNTRMAANKAALKAMIINKIGDYFLLFGIALFFFFFNTSLLSSLSLSFSIGSSSLVELLQLKISFLGIKFSLISFISFVLFIGVMAKSAQFGLHTWLPDAMEGPTPVSALIHAATMVTAGVFLMVRLHFFFLFASGLHGFIIFIGTLTTFFAASVALVQNDIKKIIAYSTCSQLGYMITACGFNLYGFAFFHLVTHAFFKALLFLGAGSVIHALSDEQDIRRMGGLAQKLPVTFFTMFLATLSLVGFPFLSGFYSKESILNAIFDMGTGAAVFAYFFGVMSVFFTTFYSFRLLFLVFFGKPNGSTSVYSKIAATSGYILFPLVILSYFSIFLGYASQELFETLELNYFYLKNPISEYVFFRFLPLGCVCFGIVFSYIVFLSRFRMYFLGILTSTIGKQLYQFLNKKWFIDSFYNHFITKPIFIISYTIFYEKIEKGWLEFLGPTGIAKFLACVSTKLTILHSNSLKNYFFYSIFFTLIFLLVC